MDIFIRFDDNDNWQDKVLNSISLIEDHIENYGVNNSYNIKFKSKNEVQVYNGAGINRQNYELVDD